MFFAILASCCDACMNFTSTLHAVDCEFGLFILCISVFVDGLGTMVLWFQFKSVLRGIWLRNYMVSQLKEQTHPIMASDNRFSLLQT